MALVVELALAMETMPRLPTEITMMPQMGVAMERRGIKSRIKKVKAS
jgi:hypothetical protein